MHSLVKSWPVRETEGRYKIIREKGIFKFLWGGGEKTINKAKTLNIETNLDTIEHYTKIHVGKPWSPPS